MSPVRRASSVPNLRSAVEGAPQPEPGPGRPERVQKPARPVKPVRFTVDLSPEAHKVLRQLALDMDCDAAVIMRELLRQIRTDPDLFRRVNDSIWARRTREQEIAGE